MRRHFTKEDMQMQIDIEKMFSIISHQENANENYEVPLHLY